MSVVDRYHFFFAVENSTANLRVLPIPWRCPTCGKQGYGDARPSRITWPKTPMVLSQIAAAARGGPANPAAARGSRPVRPNCGGCGGGSICEHSRGRLTCRDRVRGRLGMRARRGEVEVQGVLRRLDIRAQQAEVEVQGVLVRLDMRARQGEVGVQGVRSRTQAGATSMPVPAVPRRHRFLVAR